MILLNAAVTFILTRGPYAVKELHIMSERYR